MSRIFLILFIFSFFPSAVEAQSNLQSDTLSLSLESIENLFFKNNFDLLAARYQINEADAAIIQAKLWDNPSVDFEQGAYNTGTKKWFDFSRNGESAGSIQQLIYLAGKRNKRINIEKINSQIARYQFYDLLRNLRYELRTSFFDLYLLQQSLSVYDRELVALKILVDAYESEYKKGNVSFKELARLQALQFNLENEKIDVLKDVSEKETNLVLLIGDTLSRPIKPVASLSVYDALRADSYNLSQLIDTGLIRRYDLKMSDASIVSETTNLSLQKAMRIPDLTLGVRYDKAGSYVHDYNALSLGFDLPFWNRNQGNIKISENKIEEDRAIKNQKELQIKSDIARAYARFIETDKLYKSSSGKFDDRYEKLFEGLADAYKMHTISLLEFVDYYETYKNSKNEFLKLLNNRLDAIEELNLVTGSIIVK